MVYGKFIVSLFSACPSCIMYRIQKENAVCILVVDNPVIAYFFSWGKGGIHMGKLFNYKHMEAQEDVYKYKGEERM